MTTMTTIATIDNTNCIVCYESFNNSNRKNIKCNYCDTEICKKCMQTYVSQGETVEILCVNTTCKKIWSDDFIQTNTAKNFYSTKYKEKKQNIMFNIERSFIPETQKFVEADIKSNNIYKEIFRKKQLIEKLKNEIIMDRNEIYNINNEVKNKTRTKNAVIHKCPGDKCNGFLTDFYCGICDTRVCKHCREILPKIEEGGSGSNSSNMSSEGNKQHVCDEDILKNVKTLLRETKPCPECTTTIFKIDGCDQMFCTICNTAFSWKTLEIEKGVIHNPHYYQWMRNTTGNVPRNPGDDGGGGGGDNCNRRNNVNRAHLQHSINNKIAKSVSKTDECLLFWDIYRNMNHIQYVDLVHVYGARLINTNVNNFDKNLDLRKMFLKNEISEIAFKKEVFKRAKNNNKKTEIMQILTLYVHTIGDYINNVFEVNEIITLEVLKDFIKKAEEVKIFANDALNSISERYGNKCPIIEY